MTIFDFIRLELGDDHAASLDDYTLSVIVDAVLKYQLLQENDHG